MARLSLDGVPKKATTFGALHRIGQVIRGFDNSLAELNQVETMLARETAEAHDDGGSAAAADDLQEEGPDLHFAVYMLKEMVESLVADINSALELEEVLLAIQESSEPTDPPPKHQSPTPGAAKAARISLLESTEAERSPGTCKHTCTHHAEVMDPWIWSRLPENLIANVFARLPIPHIFAIPALSKAWSATSTSSSFRQVSAETHSKLFGILGFNPHVEIVLFEGDSRKWYYHEPRSLPLEYRADAMYAHDGGLVCCVPPSGKDPILVCNPLTNSWKTLPLLDFNAKEPVLVQLNVDVGTGSYRVGMVCRDRSLGVFAADCYDSQTGLWSPLEFGLVCGVGVGNGAKVFDCRTRTLCGIENHPSLRGLGAREHAVVGGRVFMLLECGDPGSLRYLVTEFVWETSSGLELRKVKSYESTLEEVPNGYTVKLFSSHGLLLLVADNCEENYQNHHQLMRVCDIVSEEWRDLPVLNESYSLDLLRDCFMSELRWDAAP